MSFVKPRVLSTAQIASLKDGVDAWRDRAEATLRYLDDHTGKGDLFA